MSRSSDPSAPRARHLRLLDSPVAATLPAVVPLLRPDQPVTPRQDAMLTGLARRARAGDRDASDLLWRAFAPKLEPAILRCGGMTWQVEWPRRDGRPWALDDLRQEAWLTFNDLIADWSGEGSFIPYAVAFFPWRLRNALRRLGPPRRRAPLPAAAAASGECGELLDAEEEALFAAVTAALSPEDAAVLRLRVLDGASLGEIARSRGVSRRTMARRWARICRLARASLRRASNGGRADP
jgi:RNA polymerase sigma factor (sigma-70 family)